jgi:hypothetical protein
LTGKYKRGEKLGSTSGRIAYISNDEKGASEAGPAWSKYANNESYWKLMSVMEDVAKIDNVSEWDVVSVTCTIKIQLPSPLAQALYLARQHYKRTVPSENDNNRIIDVRENRRRSHETQSPMG